MARAAERLLWRQLSDAVKGLSYLRFDDTPLALAATILGVVMTDRPNFQSADNVTELIYQLVGAGSVCWENPGGAGVFDNGLAKQVAEAGIERLIELGWW